MKTVLRPAAALGLAVALALGAGACSGRTESAGRAEETRRPGASAGPTARAEPADLADGTGRTAGSDTPATGNRPAGGGFRIGLLLPETTTARYERFDKPFFEAEVTRLCPACEVRYANAHQRADTQRQQAEAMFAGGVDALVLAAVDTRAAATIVTSAKSRNIPVIAYDRLAEGPVSGYVSADDEAVGRVQGTTLLHAITRGGDAKRAPVIMVTAPSADATLRGARQALDGHVIIGGEYDTPGGIALSDSAEKPGSFEAVVRDGTKQALAALGGPGKVAGIYAADDRMAGGVIAALKAAGFASPLPPVTGRDATPAALRRIIAGDQYMTVFTPYLPQARAAAEMALAAAAGTPYTAANRTWDNGTADIPAVIVDPVAVTRDNLEDTVLRKPYYAAAEICTPEYAEECRAAGLR